MENRKIIVIGGDTRAYYMAIELSRYGYDVSTYGVPLMAFHRGEPFFVHAEYQEECINNSDIIILPIPFSKDHKTVRWESGKDVVLLSEICDAMREGQLLFGGQLTEELKKSCKEKGVLYYDFMELPAVTIKNAIATAEGAIAEAIKEGLDNLHQSTCLVIGYGQCGKVLADKLKGLNANVVVMARRVESRKEAEALGFQTLPMFHEEMSIHERISYIFNTVPALVLPSGILQHLPASVVIIDIASAPGGCDYTYCKKKGIHAKLCPGLPGQYAPKTSGEILAKAIAIEIGNEIAKNTYNTVST
ncbi:MAG TPA: dipicolinate synthase subunit DpsA [Lachnospiraceae bacterium]|nr:dipicolinate synthase subunit DpsA [Lachnospiraceae bacterium]